MKNDYKKPFCISVYYTVLYTPRIDDFVYSYHCTKLLNLKSYVFVIKVFNKQYLI